MFLPKEMVLSRKIPIIYFIFFLAIILSASCRTSRIIPFSTIDKRHSPETVILKDSTEYRIYSYYVTNIISGDSLILSNRKTHNTLAIIPESAVSLLIDKRNVRKDSPYYYTLIILPLLITVNF